MTSTIAPEELYFGAPASLTFNGVDCGATLDAPKFSLDVTTYVPEFMNAKGPVIGTAITTKVIPSVEMTVNQITAQKLAWAMPGSASTTSESVGVAVAGLVTTLAADPALAATTISLTSVTTVAVGDFILVGTTLTEALSEVVRVTVKGTAGGGDTIVENSAGGGLLIDHGNGENVKTCLGTILAAPAAAGATNIKVDAVTGSGLIAPGNFIRIGYVGHYETREVTTVGTIGPAGTGVSFAIPLTMDHSLDEWVIVVTSLGATTIAWTPGRIDSSNYKTLVLTGVGLDGRQMIITLLNAMSAESQELEFSDASVSGLKVKFTGYYAAATPTVAPFSIQLD